MKKLLLVSLLLVHVCIYAQQDLGALAKPIVEEGKRLYRSEMASWYGTDLFLVKYKEKARIGGYFSYTENKVSKCIFFSKGNPAKVIGTILFDSTYNVKTAGLDLSERSFTPNELDLYTIRMRALDLIQKDKFFKTYSNSDLNLIPMIYGGEKKVFVLTGPKENGVAIFGNDYLINFTSDNQISDKKQLHNNIIPIDFTPKDNGALEVQGAMHSHLPETGDLITSTDICTLMLYEKVAKWKKHTVVSAKYICKWNCITDELIIAPMDDKQ